MIDVSAIARRLGRVLAVSALALASAAYTQEYPVRPVRVIIGSEPGSAPDTVARLVGQQLTVQMGQPFVVETRPGATGNIGSDAVAKAAPDGYTLLVTSAQFAASPSLYKLPFDVYNDFLPITNIASGGGFILLVHPSVQAESVQDLIALTRRPGSRISFSSPGVGNPLHHAGELFSDRAAAPMVHVPYKSGGGALTALLSAQVQVMFGTPLTTLAHIQAGKLRALAYTGSKRASYLPGVPTIAEAGVPESQLEDMSWYGMLAPARMPEAIAARLQREVHRAIENPTLRERFEALRVSPVGNTPAEFRAFLDVQIRRFAELTKLAGVRPESASH